MGLGRREEEVPLAGVLCEDPPASESAAVRSPYMGETRAAFAAARPWGRIRPRRVLSHIPSGLPSSYGCSLRAALEVPCRTTIQRAALEKKEEKSPIGASL